MKFSIKHLLYMRSRQIVLFLIDVVCFAFLNSAYYFLSSYTSEYVYGTSSYIASSAVLMACLFFFRYGFGNYSNIWRYANSKAYLDMVISDAISGIAAIVTGLIFKWDDTLHIIIVTALFALMTLSSRFSYSIVHKHNNIPTGKKINVAIIGAGQIGALLAEELLYSKNSHYNPIAFIDKDPAKRGGKVSGIKVYYEDGRIIDTIKALPIQEIFIALNKLDSSRVEEIYNKYVQTGCKIKLYDTPVKDVGEANSQSKRRTIRELHIEDLLFRKSLVINNEESLSYYSGKTILITGGGGSIGSELCRQIAKCNPKKLIILDIYENNVYDIQQELLRYYENKLDLEVEIASVRDRARLDCIFDKYRPEIVFHAAAHKHVPLMEHSNCEAVKNNVIGTYNTADMAEKYGAYKFILISTDKAVNPTNIMGASKRMCEMIVQCRTDSNTSFAAVRFGNVLGSNGSVIPLFKKQIENGGPITITDKRIIRYFMTIPEASQLVMQAGAMAKKGELFVLDMGKPVRIYDLAVNMIKLSGLTPEVDINIEEIGLRPGEKLFEELLIKSETLSKTDNNMIFIEKDHPLSRTEVDAKIEMLTNAVKTAEHEIESDAIKMAFKATVPTYYDPEDVNCNAEKSEEMQVLQK